MQCHYRPSIYRPNDGQTSPVGFASGKHWQECRHQWKTLAPKGACNCIDTGTTAGSDTVFGFIGGGQDIMVCAGACHSSIVGGQGNRVLHKWATVSGCGVTSVIDCAFHTNQLLSANTQVYTGAIPGILQYIPVPPALAALGVPATACLVLI